MVEMEDKKQLDVEKSFSSDVNVDELYDKVVGFLSSEEADGYCPDVWDLVDNPALMELQEAPDCVKQLSHFIPYLSEEKKERLIKLVYKAIFDCLDYTTFYISDVIDYIDDVEKLKAYNDFYYERLEVVDIFYDELKGDHKA